MKLFFFLTLSLFGFISFAQPPGGGSSRGRAPGGFNFNEMVLREKDNVMKIDNLNWMQQELLDGIYTEYGTTMQETFQEIRKTRNFGEMRTKMTSLQEEKNLLIKDVLNDNQYQKYLSLAGNGMRGRQSRQNDEN